MLEVCFSNSVKGALAIAQHCGGEHLSTAYGVILGNEESIDESAKQEIIEQFKLQQEERARSAVSLGGNRDELIELSGIFSIGDIKSPIAQECPRKELIRRLYSSNPFDEFDDIDETVDEVWGDFLSDLNTLKRRAVNEPVRIWADLTPDTACGLLFVADALCDIDCDVTLISLPARLENEDGTVTQLVGWGEMFPEDFGKYAQSGIRLSKNILRSMSLDWKRLQKENAPLRVVLGSEVHSVGIDFYDSFIRREFSEDEMTVAMIIGTVLGKNRLGIGDWLLAERIRAMLESGELVLKEKSDVGFYRSTVIKA